MTNQKVNARYSPEARDIYFTVPNLISALRIISIPFISVLISKHEMIAALALIAISSASDGLDGIIARRFNQVSKIGQILDPIADRLLIFCSILALSVGGIIPWWMLIIVGLRDLWMAIQVLWLAQYGYGPLPVHFVGKAGTALLMISIVGLIFADLGTSTFFHLLYNAALAAASGINVEQVVRIVWIISCGMAALSGVLLGIYLNGISWNTGATLLLLMFAAVTLGGLGTANGALVGSLIIGIVADMSSLIIPNDMRYASALAILIIVLLIRPQGLFGKQQRVG